MAKKLYRCKFLHLDSGLLIFNCEDGEIIQLLKIDLSEIKYIGEVKIIKSKYCWNNQAVKLIDEDNYKEALDCIEKSLEMDANFYSAWHNKGICLAKMGMLEGSEQAFRRGLELEPNNVNALEGMGYILSLLGRQEEALVYYEKALAINPNFRVRVNREKVICQKNRQHLESSLSQS